MNKYFLQAMIDDGLLKGGRALDLGCGEGIQSLFLENNGFEVYSVDKIDRKNVKYFINADVRKLSIESNFYDFILARNVLPFFTKQEAKDTIKRMYAGLKKGGVMYFTLFGDKDPWSVHKHMSFFSEKEVDAVVKGIPVYEKLIKYGLGKKMDGEVKMWHIFSFICKKP